MTEIEFYIIIVVEITLYLILAICFHAIMRCNWVRDQRIKLLEENPELYEKLPPFNEMVGGHGFWWWNIERYLPEKKITMRNDRIDGMAISIENYILANGRDLGASAMCMICVAYDYPLNGLEDIYYPIDPDDFNRCLMLLHEIPEIRNSFDKIADLSPLWKKIITRWEEVEKCFLAEAGLGWSKAYQAPKTYRLMQEIYKKE